MSHLSEAARLEYYLAVGAALPLPADPTEAHRESRLCTAIEAFNALRPGNAYEALLAVQIVVAGAHALECLRGASLHHDDFNKTAICRNQAAAMMREARAAKRILAQEQKLRLSVDLIAYSQDAQQPGSIAPQPAPAVQPADPTPAAEPQQQTVASLHVVPTGAASEPAASGATPPPSREAIAQAEAFALDNIIAAALIRQERGITPQNKPLLRGVTLPADPAVIDALARGSSPILDGLDGLNQEVLDVAA